MKYILGKKIEMSQIFEEEGQVIPVTLVEAGPCLVTQIKTEKKDGYKAVQLDLDGSRKEVRGESDWKKGDEVTVSVFEKGDKVNVIGVSKGKGYAGGVKRHGFVDKAKAHGAKDMRRIGSTGSRFPQRTPKGRGMPGRMGTDRVTVKNLEIAAVDEKNGILAIKGATPGYRGTLLEIMES